MKKSLLLLSLLVVTNAISQPKNSVASVDKKVNAVDAAVEAEEAIKDKAALRPKGETPEEYLESCGGKVPHVPAHQGAENKCLHKATGSKVASRIKRTVQSPRAVRKANKSVVNATQAKN